MYLLEALSLCVVSMLESDEEIEPAPHDREEQDAANHQKYIHVLEIDFFVEHGFPFILAPNADDSAFCPGF